jgi:hypothetical protein
MKRAVLAIAVAAVASFVHAQSAGAKKASACEGRLKEEKPDTAEAVKHFWQDFQTALQENDKRRLAAMADYPMNANLPHETVKVHTRDEFIKRYVEIFPDKLRQLLVKEPADCIGRVGWRGFTVAEGQVWFDQHSDGTVRITAVNVVLYHSD